MKIKIITMHRIYNYGSVLQTYATQKFFERYSNDVSVIDYVTPWGTFFKKWLNGSKNPIYLAGKLLSVFLKEMTIGRFLRKNISLTKKYISFADLANDAPEADLFVTGSDQTWNPDYTFGIDEGYYLGFTDKKKISFAASFGKSRFNKEETGRTKELLSKYDLITVREISGLGILKSMGLQGKVIIDPTLQLTKEDWISISSKRLIKEKYLILMLLYNEDNHATEYARKIADEKGLKLVKLSWELRKPAMVDKLMTHRSPADFISLFSNAEFVVTNSFHGLAFSINLNKQFIVVPRLEYNTRLESLLEVTRLESRMADDEESAINSARQHIDYDFVNSILEKERMKSKEYFDDYFEVNFNEYSV